MKKSLSWTLLGLIVLLINACLDDDTSPQPDLYEGCCSVEPGQFSMNGVNIYVHRRGMMGIAVYTVKEWCE